MVSSTTTREGEFSAEDVGLLLAFARYESDRGPHGHSLAKSTSPGADPNEYGTALRYVGHGPFTDWAKKAELDKEDAYRASFPKDAVVNQNGHYYTVEEIEG